MEKDRDIKMIASGIGFSLAVMLSLIATTILSFVFGDMRRANSVMFFHKYGSVVALLGIILIATPVLLMLKAYFSEYLKNYQHPFFRNKFENVKIVIFFVVFFTIMLGIRL